MSCRGRTIAVLTAVGATAFAVLPGSALAAFPYAPGGLPRGQVPNDLTGKRVWMYAATPERGNEPVNSQPQELYGVRGAHIVDAADVDTAWQTTTGRPDVTIAVLDSGIKWNDRAGMADLRLKTRLWKPELERPRVDRPVGLEQGVDCLGYRTRTWDANGDGVFNVLDYACDPRVEIAPTKGVGPEDVLDPQDVLIAFSDGLDDDRNGFVDDIVGWDFLDDDNDPFDDVQYGHGTGEARDSTAEADNEGELGTCPNCMAIHMRVGDSFIADSADFAQAVLYAVDNRALVIQEALGTLNNTGIGRAAVDYAYRHGVAVIASAADEAAQHHNYPSSYPHTIVVNSVTQFDELLTPVPRSYLQFNGCTNFSSKISVAIPSVSCSSDATGRASGMAGLIYSAALDAIAHGKLSRHPTCRLASGKACPLSANEVRQLLASGRVGGEAVVDDVSFARQPEPACFPAPLPGCTDPNMNAPGDRFVFSPLVTTRRYPARKGHDQFYGWGRVNMNRTVDAAAAGLVPPEAEITSPEWFDAIDPRRPAFDVRGQVGARERPYRCRVLVAPGSQPNNAEVTDDPPGDFAELPSSWCDGRTRDQPFDGVLATIDVAQLKERFPANAGDFRGRESGTGGQTENGRPNVEPYGFTVKLVVEAEQDGTGLSGEDRRNLFLHRDRDLLEAFPLSLPSDGASAPAFADLDGDNSNELILGTSDGLVHAFRSDGTELSGWPVRGRPLPLHLGSRAFRSGEVSRRFGGAILASVAVGDLDRDGSPEVVAADYEGFVHGWNGRGRRVFGARANPAWSGRPHDRFVNEREGSRNRTQHGFIASPVLADLDGDLDLEIVAAAMDRHVYAWHHDGSWLEGFPVLVVDPQKVDTIDPHSHQVRFNEKAGEEALDQGAIIDTPAVGDITGDGRPEIVVGTNEEYEVGAPGEDGVNAGNLNSASLALLSQTDIIDFANSRLYAIRAEGDRDGDPNPAGTFVDGWPVKIGRVFAELLPIVGEGVTGSPVIGPVDCPSGGAGPKVGSIPDAGLAYVLNPDGTSCYGKDPTNGKDIGMQTDVAVALGKTDLPVLPAVGQPAFGNFAGGVSFLAPAAGVMRALDLAVNEFQGGQDFMAVWDPRSGQFRPNFPQRMNDLQFLTGPSVADIDGEPGEELVAGSAYLDLQAYDGLGRPVSSAWPKLTTDWTVANPLIGPFGEGGRKAVVGLTRSGKVLAYRTRAPACSPGSWPRFHHDNANSGDYSRDATAPGAPTEVRLEGGRLTWRAPGDDLLCGRAARYEITTAGGRRLDGAPQPARPGTQQSLDLTSDVGRLVAIRAVDEQGNLGRPAIARVP